jgi:DNA polymerase-1
MQAVAATGRLSSNQPNLQNIPIRTSRGKEIRKAFVARDENHVLVSADYSQVELRIIAALSGDKNMIEAFQQGEDIHKATASKVFNVPLDEVTKDMRSKAKAVNFGIIYGQGPFGLAQQLGISRTEAKNIIEGQGMGAQIQGAFPGIAGFFGGDQVAANKFLEGLTVDETLLNTARTKGAISNQEMNLFKAPIPSATDDREKVWKPWIEKRLEVLNKLKTFYEGEVARGTAAGNPPANPAAPNASNVPAPAAAPSGGPARISSEGEWANLPSGTQYIGPDGKLRTKR